MNVSERPRSQALRELRRNRGVLVWLGAASSTVLFGAIAYWFSDHRGLILLAVAGTLTALTLGIGYAREWARMLAGMTSAAYSVMNLWAAVGIAVGQGRAATSESRVEATINALGVGTLMAFLAWSALRPSTESRFAQARSCLRQT
jgi:hypothetical protein